MIPSQGISMIDNDGQKWVSSKNTPESWVPAMIDLS